LAAKKIWAIGTRFEATISAPARASCSAAASRPVSAKANTRPAAAISQIAVMAVPDRAANPRVRLGAGALGKAWQRRRQSG